MRHILIVEDDIAFGTMLQTWLRRKGFEVDKATSMGAAVKLLVDMKSVDLVLSDLRLPDHDGLRLLAWMHEHSINAPFIVMTNYAEVQNAVLAMKSGAADYIAKPVQPDILLQKINDAMEQNTQQNNATIQNSTTQNAPTAHNSKLKTQNSEAAPRYIEGKSEASRQLYSYVELVAPTPMSVLILGASGTGKEYVAHRIHDLSQRHDRPFFALDCGAIPRDVAASEFFGHKKGAFTGADADKRGAFEIANGGTLFLDEVGNLSYEVQVQLLRALQERRIRPVGGTKEIDIDIRLVCATNENLEEAVSEGRFREDLYHRINEFTIYMPKLSERGSDLFLFADLFIRHANEELNRNVEGFDSGAAEMLASHSWPGNLRELNNVVKRAVLLTRGSQITTAELTLAMGQIRTDNVLQLHDEDTERQRIITALQQTNGNKAKAARLLGVDRKTIYNKIEKLGI
ncbi:sigma-54 dependent transcriptional regulator [Prevotella stercorea]|uniref:sigma-54-dependent transcriptional regulator n=1 Tax=Leyella stercorea TaxID=363265 RepID=UPI001C2BD3D9|nr:sigma-54 dependent transcriptional regulator [Leyella stercorea]MBU9897175.1 sigma-54 dependent transcriptional regulator [Leyella stercorea]MBU9945396.1 sigma-54 dependent transcriptional regulator [Leyella stercorea]